MRLNDDHRRGLVCAFMTTVHSSVDHLDEALATGSRALEIAERLGDSRLRFLSTSCLAQVHCYRGDYERAVELATKNLAALPAEWINEHFGMAVPVSIFDRAWLIMSLAELGRFAEAAKYEAEAIKIAEATEYAFTIGWAHFAASIPHLIKGDWEKARTLVRALDHDASHRERRHSPSLGGRRLRLGAGADWRSKRGAGPDQ